MGVLGPINGLTFADDGLLGVVSVSNPQNAAQEDGSYVTWVLLLGQLGHYLKSTGYQFAVPLDASITGVQVRVKRGATVSLGATDASLRLVKAGTIQGTDLLDASAWPTTPAFGTYGGEGQMWGLTLTAAEANASDFGAAIAPSAALASTAQVDCVDIAIYYQGSNRPGNIGQRFGSSDGMGFGR